MASGHRGWSERRWPSAPLTTWGLAFAVGLAAAAASADEAARSPRPIVLFVDADDDDDDGVADGRQAAAPTSAEIRWLEPAPPGGFRLRAIRGRAVRVVDGTSSYGEGDALQRLGPFARLGLVGIEPGVAHVELDSGAIEARVYELRAIDARGRRVDLVASHASLSRTLPTSLRPVEERRSSEDDALRWLVVGVPSDMPKQLSIVSTAPDGRPLDALDAVAVEPTPCPKGTPEPLVCAATALIRATMDRLDRSHPRAAGSSLHAEVGGRLSIFGAGLKAASIRVGGPRQSALGPLERFRGRLRVRILRTGPGGGAAVGSDDAGAVELLRRELASANALWGQCGIHFGDPAELDVRVVDPPPPHLFAVGCGLGLPATGGTIALAVGDRRLTFRTRAGASPARVARALSGELARRGFQATLSPNPRESFSALASVDVLVRGARGEYVPLDLLPSAEPERSLEVCVGAINLNDGLSHFMDADASTGTLEERTLLKALMDDDGQTIDVLVVPYFVTMGRIGESFVHARGLGVRNAIIVDRAGVRAGARSFALAHELGHVLLQVAGHPDDFGTDLPTSLMDADAADPTIFGPRRLSVADCERAILQSGPDAPVPLLRHWPLIEPSR